MSAGTDLHRITLTDDDGALLSSATVEAPTDTVPGMRAARDAAWAATVHYGRAVTARDDNGNGIVRVSCEWLEDD
jgi:hypothetical protein